MALSGALEWAFWKIQRWHCFFFMAVVYDLWIHNSSLLFVYSHRTESQKCLTLPASCVNRACFPRHPPRGFIYRWQKRGLLGKMKKKVSTFLKFSWPSQTRAFYNCESCSLWCQLPTITKYNASKVLPCTADAFKNSRFVRCTRKKLGFNSLHCFKKSLQPLGYGEYSDKLETGQLLTWPRCGSYMLSSVQPSAPVETPGAVVIVSVPDSFQVFTCANARGTERGVAHSHSRSGGVGVDEEKRNQLKRLPVLRKEV